MTPWWKTVGWTSALHTVIIITTNEFGDPVWHHLIDCIYQVMFTKEVDGSVIYVRIIRYEEVDWLALSVKFKQHTAASTMKKEGGERLVSEWWRGDGQRWTFSADNMFYMHTLCIRLANHITAEETKNTEIKEAKNLCTAAWNCGVWWLFSVGSLPETGAFILHRIIWSIVNTKIPVNAALLAFLKWNETLLCVWQTLMHITLYSQLQSAQMWFKLKSAKDQNVTPHSNVCKKMRWSFNLK